MIIDVHVHLVATETRAGCFVSPSLRRSFLWRFLKWKLGLSGLPEGRDLDRAYAEKLADWVREAGDEGEVDRAVVFGLDGVCDRRGRLDLDRTSIRIPNDLVRRTVRTHSDVLLYGTSINPERRDAIERLERAAEDGAVLCKWLPNTQGFDPSDAAHRPFYRRLAELDLPLLTHTGYEHTLPALDQDLGDPALLRPALDEGVTVIAAHAGTSGIGHRVEHLDAFLELLSAYPNLHGDVSALQNISRLPYVKRLLAHDLAPERLLYGSDFPVPPTPLLLAPRVGLRKAWRLSRRSNPIARAAATLRAAGVPEAVYERGAEVLAPRLEMALPGRG